MRPTTTNALPRHALRDVPGARATTRAAWAHAAAVRAIADGLEADEARALTRPDDARRTDLPDTLDVEDAMRSELALFHAATQPTELAAMRALARRWMARLDAWRPLLGGAVWRGVATARHAVHLDVHPDDAKAFAFALANEGLDVTVQPPSRLSPHDAREGTGEVLVLHDVLPDALRAAPATGPRESRAPGPPRWDDAASTPRAADGRTRRDNVVRIRLRVAAPHALRHAARTDARGERWRGDAAALDARAAATPPPFPSADALLAPPTAR